MWALIWAVPVQPRSAHSNCGVWNTRSVKQPFIAITARSTLILSKVLTAIDYLRSYAAPDSGLRGQPRTAPGSVNIIPVVWAQLPRPHSNISQPLEGRSSPYCWDMRGRYCCLTSFFLIVNTCLSCEDMAWQSCAMVHRWQFFASCISSEPRAARFRPAF